MNEAASFKVLQKIALNELEKRTFKGLPTCLKVSNEKYIIGRCKVNKDSTNWVVLDNSQTIPFISLTSALCYSICVQTQCEKDAKSIAYLDNHVRFLTSESTDYKARLDEAKKKKDGWKQDLYLARFKQANELLTQVNLELKKKLSSAKYIKLKDFKL